MIRITLLHLAVIDPSAQRPHKEFHKALFLDHVLYKVSTTEYNNISYYAGLNKSCIRLSDTLFDLLKISSFSKFYSASNI